MPASDGWISMLVFLVTSGLILLIYAWRNRDLLQAQARVRELGPAPRRADESGRGRKWLSRLPAMAVPLLPEDADQRGRLQVRLHQAGLYGPHALLLFLGAKMLFLVLAVVLAVGAIVSQLLPPNRAAVVGALLGGTALAGPGIWLDARKRRRQTHMRRALPDALDMLVLCVEGGVSLPQAVQRVTAELHDAHPLLGAEMDIVQREMLLGLSVGEALRKFGDRTDLEDVRSLASVLLQNERYGASVARALRIHADTLRQERQQKAEEQAQKASVKILFPTLLCIFPAVFLVILGPAAFQILAVFSRMKGR
jgi:tight adherence protein C